MGLRVEIPKDTNKLKQQIKALEYQVHHDTVDKDIEIHKAALKRLYDELLYREYLNLQSEEFKEDVTGYKKLTMYGKDVAIKVNFAWGWLRVYRTKTGKIEWY